VIQGRFGNEENMGWQTRTWGCRKHSHYSEIRL